MCSYFIHSCISDQITNLFAVDRAPYCVWERNKSYQWCHARTKKLFHTLPFYIIHTIFSFLNHIFQVREHILTYNSGKWKFKEEQRLYFHQNKEKDKGKYHDISKWVMSLYNMYPELELFDHIVNIFLIFWEPSYCFPWLYGFTFPHYVRTVIIV